jgi:hypothetical protein
VHPDLDLEQRQPAELGVQGGSSGFLNPGFSTRLQFSVIDPIDTKISHLLGLSPIGAVGNIGLDTCQNVQVHLPTIAA